VIASLIWGAVLFLGAWALFERCTREQKVAAPSRGLLPRAGGFLRFLGPGRAWTRALVWKSFFFVAGGRAVIAVKAVVFTVLFVSVAVLRRALDGGSPGSVSLIECLEAAGYVTFVVVLVFSAIEAGAFASRLFSTEVKSRTLSGLCMLPVPRGRIVRRAGLGVLIGFVPNLVFVILALLCVPEFVGGFFEELFEEPVLFVGILMVLSEFALFLYLTVLLSLYLKWGAFPLAFVILLFAQQCVFSGGLFLFIQLLGWMPGELGVAVHMAVLTGVSVALCCLFYRLTLRRLTYLAGHAA